MASGVFFVELASPVVLVVGHESLCLLCVGLGRSCFAFSAQVGAGSGWDSSYSPTLPVPLQ